MSDNIPALELLQQARECGCGICDACVFAEKQNRASNNVAVELEEIANCLCDDRGNKVSPSITTVMRVRDLAKRVAVETNGDWRPIETFDFEQGFANSQWVLVHTSDGRVTEGLPFIYDANKRGWICACGNNAHDPRYIPSPSALRDTVTHWMPKPEPPRSSEKSNEQPSAPAVSPTPHEPASSSGSAAGAVPICSKHGVSLAFEGDECWACKEDADAPINS